MGNFDTQNCSEIIFYQTEGTLVHIIRAYTALYIGGTPSQKDRY